VRRTWDIIVPGNFGGDEHTDLLFYDRRAGDGKIYATNGQGDLTLLKHHTGWKKTWNIIVPGNFGGGGQTDLLFYRRVIGDAKFFTTDGAGNLNLLKAHAGWHKQWDLILPGNFSLGSFTDLVFYDRVAGLGRFASTDGQGGVSEISKHNWRTSWSHIVAGELGGQIGLTDLLFYENQLRLKLHAVACANSDGTRAVQMTAPQAKMWVDRANAVYAASGVFLDFDPAADWELLKDTVINSVGKGDEAGKQAASDYAAAFPGKVVVFFRWGPGTSTDPKTRTGGGFSAGAGNFVAMPDFSATKTDMYYQDGTKQANVQNIKLFAHELAHYLGCPHPFVSVQYYDDSGQPLFADPNDAVVAYLKEDGGISLDALDNDKAYVCDTAPDVGKDFFLLKSQNPADLSLEVTVSSAADGIELTFNPDRHTVSSYFNCDDYYRVTPDQVRRIREHLMADHRKALIAGQV